MKDKSKAIAAHENDVAKATKAFEKFPANKKRLEQIDTASKELEVIFPELKKDVAGKSRETHKIYDGLVKLQEQQWMIAPRMLLTLMNMLEMFKQLRIS